MITHGPRASFSLYTWQFLDLRFGSRSGIGQARRRRILDIRIEAFSSKRQDDVKNLEKKRRSGAPATEVAGYRTS
jgi:hypothetical protein